MQTNQNITEIEHCTLALDIGGTFVKSGLVSASGLIEMFSPVSVDADGDSQSVIKSFADVIFNGMSAARCGITSVGVCVPGPFDYSRGVSLMTHKFAALYGIDLIAALRGILPGLAIVPIRFRHDANAFLAGELWLGAGRGARRLLGVTLGTGIGVSCSVDGAFLTNAQGSPAPDVSVWSLPYKEGVVEDAVSTKGVVARYRLMHQGYNPAKGVKGIAEAAMTGNCDALRVFEELGRDLGVVLRPLCERHCPERIIFGGQIARSFDLFQEVLKAELKLSCRRPEVLAAQLGAQAALLGAVLKECRGETPVRAGAPVKLYTRNSMDVG